MQSMNDLDLNFAKMLLLYNITLSHDLLYIWCTFWNDVCQSFFFCRLIELGKVWNNKCSGEIQVKCRSTGEGYHHRWRDASPGPQFSLLLGVIAQCGTPDCLLLCCHQANPGLPRLSELGSFLHWSAHGSLRQQALRAPADGIHSIFLLFIFNEWCQKLWSDIC